MIQRPLPSTLLLTLALVGCPAAKPAPPKADNTTPPPASTGQPASPTPAAPTGASSNTITVKGSDTMVLIAQRWAETYMNAHKEVSIQVTGGGSGTGIAAIIDGTCNIADASRPMKPAEIAKAKSNGKEIVEHKVALDALCIVVNPKNPINELSVAQLKGLFSGAITDWGSVGGTSGAVTIYSRESSSGTYDFVKEHILGDADYSPKAQTLSGTAAILNAIAKDPSSIGYGGAAYFATHPEVKILGVKTDKGATAVNPVSGGKLDEQVVRSMTYPISRYLYCYTAGEPTGPIKAYLDWIVSDEGQKLVRELEYVPLTDVK